MFLKNSSALITRKQTLCTLNLWIYIFDTKLSSHSQILSMLLVTNKPHGFSELMILDIMFLVFQPKMLLKIIKNLRADLFSSDHLIFFKESWKPEKHGIQTFCFRKPVKTKPSCSCCTTCPGYRYREFSEVASKLESCCLILYLFIHNTFLLLCVILIIYTGTTTLAISFTTFSNKSFCNSKEENTWDLISRRVCRKATLQQDWRAPAQARDIILQK